MKREREEENLMRDSTKMGQISWYMDILCLIIISENRGFLIKRAPLTE